MPESKRIPSAKGRATDNKKNGHFEKFINGQLTTNNGKLNIASASPVKFFAKDSGADLTGVVRRWRTEVNT
jgi:hypothetical protein